MFLTKILGTMYQNGRVGIRALTIRDMKRRQLFERSEVIRRAYLFVSRNETLPDVIRTRAQQALHRMPKKCTSVQIKNTCIKTGKAGGINTTFKLSRIQFRLDASRGKIPGVKRAVW